MKFRLKELKKTWETWVKLKDSILYIVISDDHGYQRLLLYSKVHIVFNILFQQLWLR